jgi:hypothetical protein
LNAENADEGLNSMYGKIYESTFTGSMAGKGSHVFAVWAYVIANTKPDSLVELNPLLISAVLGDSAERVEQAIELLCSTDEKSRSKVCDGKRLIKKGEFLYFVPRYNHFRSLRNDEERRQYFREKKREQRQRLRLVSNGLSKTVQDKSNMSTQAESNKQKAKEEIIYSAYPKKVGKPEALKAIRKALLKTTFDDLLAKTKAYAEARSGNLNFCAHPSTWFNQERFNDDPSTWKQQHIPSTPEFMKMSWPKDWQEAKRQVRFLYDKVAEYPQAKDRIDTLKAQFKLDL